MSSVACETLNRAKILAKNKYGLLAANQIRCSAENICDGSDCLFIPLTDEQMLEMGQANVEKFYARIAITLGYVNNFAVFLDTRELSSIIER